MGNRLVSATGLDLGGWFSDGAIAAHEDGIGAPGRIAVQASGATYLSIVGAEGAISPAAPGETLYGQAFFLDHGGNSRVVMGWRDAGGVAIGADQILPVVKVATGAANRGIPATFNLARGSLVAPAGTAGVALYGLRTGAGLVTLLKPWVGDTPACPWAPGPHLNPDLDLPAWPDGLELTADGFAVESTGLRQGYAADARIPMTARVSTDSWSILRGRMSLDMAERDRLQQFYEAATEPFWFVRPDTHQVCRAWWLEDGDPADSGLGLSRSTSIGLLLEPA